MRRIPFFVIAGLVFGLLPQMDRLGPVAGPLALVGLAVLTALAASDAPTTLGVACGAVGAFTAGIVHPVSPPLAGAALAALWFGERSLRVQGLKSQLVHVGVAAVTGALASSLTATYATSAVSLRVVAVVVAAVLAGLPLLIAADDPIAHALDLAANEASGSVASSLKAAALLRRNVDESFVDPKALASVREAWATLLRLTDARARLSPLSAAKVGGAEASSHTEIVLQKVDQRILEHVATLQKAYTAVDTARAVEASLGVDALPATGERAEAAAVADPATRTVVDKS